MPYGAFSSISSRITASETNKRRVEAVESRIFLRQVTFLTLSRCLLSAGNMSTTDYASSDAYIGIWTNWSKGRILGATLTIPRREAGLLTAFLAIYVSAVGGQFWRIVCYAFHQARARQIARRGDVVHRQIQVLLRNSEGAGGGLWEFARLPFQWRYWTNNTFFKCAFFAFLAFLNLCLRRR